MNYMESDIVLVECNGQLYSVTYETSNGWTDYEVVNITPMESE